jgi:thioredoxin reductase (NADPH)
MKKSIILFSLLVVIFGACFIASPTAEDSEQQSILVEQKSPEFFLELSKTKVVIIKFSAAWCGPCRQMIPIFESVSRELSPDFYHFESINVDENSKLSDFFTVMGIPTVIILKDGQEKDRIVGLVLSEELKQRIIEKEDQLQHEKLVIIGSGPAGLTAAIYAAQAELHPVVITGATLGGQLSKTALVANWPGHTAISGQELMDSLVKHAQHAGATLMHDEISEVDFSKTPFILKTKSNKTISADSVIIAVGTTPKTLQITGEPIYWGRGISTCTICDGMFYKNKKVVVIGGGNTALEDALYMTNFADHITIIHRGNQLSGMNYLQEQVKKHPKITIKYNTVATEFQGDGKVITGILAQNTETKEMKTIDCDGVFIAIGLSPNTALFQDKLELNDGGYIKTHDQVHTSVKGVLVAGDVQHSIAYRQAIVSAGFGCVAALEAAKLLQNTNEFCV